VIAGNHEITFDTKSFSHPESKEKIFGPDYDPEDPEVCSHKGSKISKIFFLQVNRFPFLQELLTNCTCLENESIQVAENLTVSFHNTTGGEPQHLWLPAPPRHRPGALACLLPARWLVVVFSIFKKGHYIISCKVSRKLNGHGVQCQPTQISW
jgi:hypothetical protein